MEDNEEFQAVYACKQYSAFSFRVDVKRYTFEKHQLIITDKDDAAEIDAALKKYPALGGKVQKVDLAQAEALVANHAATHGGAKSGPFSSSVMSQLEPNKLGDRDASLDLMGTEEKAGLVEAMQKDSLVLTEKTAEVSAPEKPAPALKEVKAPSVLDLKKVN